MELQPELQLEVGSEPQNISRFSPSQSTNHIDSELPPSESPSLSYAEYKSRITPAPVQVPGPFNPVSYSSYTPVKTTVDANPSSYLGPSADFQISQPDLGPTNCHPLAQSFSLANTGTPHSDEINTPDSVMDALEARLYELYGPASFELA